MLYHSIPIQVSTWPTSFHQLYSMMKLAAVDAAHAKIPNKNIRTISLAICEGRIRGDFYSSSKAPLRSQKTNFERRAIAANAGQPRSYHNAREIKRQARGVSRLRMIGSGSARASVRTGTLACPLATWRNPSGQARLRVLPIKPARARTFTMLDAPGGDQYAVGEASHVRGVPSGDRWRPPIPNFWRAIPFRCPAP